jgi:transposase
MNTNEATLVRVEVVADLPVLWASLQRMDVVNICNRQLPAPLHWKGPLTPGHVLAIWLLYVLSQSDHRLSHVEPWVAQHQGTLSALVGLPVCPKDLHDDRLADLLSRLGTGDLFSLLERDLNQHIVRVYDLPDEVVRIDTTTASTFQDVQTEEGLIQFGHSKDDPDLPQLKVACAVLDPLGMPLCTACLPGNTADDPTYIPAIQSVQQSFGLGNRLYVGDCKMAALVIRAFVAASKERYLCPLSESQLSREERRKLLEPVWTGEQILQEVRRPGKEEGDPDELVAEGFSVDVQLHSTVDGKEVEWKEKRWIVRSAAYARSGEEKLERKLREAEAELRELPVRKQGKKQRFYRELHEAAETLVAEKGVEGLLSFKVRTVMTTKKKRAYKDKPERVETEVSFEMDVSREVKAIEERKREMGWQVYATNGLVMVLAAVVWAYRGQYRVEDGWSRLKGNALCLTPLFLQDETRIQGLVYLLSIALRVLTLVEWVVRENLRKEGASLRGLYPGQPGRKTERPSTELLLRAFAPISISVVSLASQNHILLSPLSPLQLRLLKLFNLPSDLYDSVARHFPKSLLDTSEP